MISGSGIVSVARSWLGTPFALNQRCNGAGVDCWGLVVSVMGELGVNGIDERVYGDGDEYERMLAQFHLFCDQVETVEPGDFLIFRQERHSEISMILNHVAIATDEGMIHACPRPAFYSVIEHPLDKFWQRALVRVFRYREAG
jgi:cell wall-associated NlpC family hydrolase